MLFFARDPRNHHDLGLSQRKGLKRNGIYYAQRHSLNNLMLHLASEEVVFF